MCDDQTELDVDEFERKGGQLNRREFGKLSAAVGIAAMLPQVVNAAEVTESDVQITTPDGVADCYFVHPSTGKHPAVLIWPDILGLRPAFRSMGKRLAESGYSVLVVNPFYRSAKSPVISEGSSFRQSETREIVLPMYRILSPETNVIDAKSFIAWLDGQEVVDTTKKIGTNGYCMGGPMVMRTAAVSPERIGAIASFHGGGLATEADDSPHLLIPSRR